MGVFNTLKAILFWTEEALQPIWPVDMLPERKASCMGKTAALCRADVRRSKCLWLRLLRGTRNRLWGTSRNIYFCCSELVLKLTSTGFQGQLLAFKSCRMHYMLGYCVCPPSLCCHSEPVGFGGEKALQAISKYIPEEEVKNVHVCMQESSPYETNSRDTGAACDCEEAETSLCSVWIINAWLKFHSARTHWHPS